MSRQGFLLCALLLGGCTRSSPGLVIGGALAPDERCAYSTGSTQLLIGTLDTAPSTIEYSVAVLLLNQLSNVSMSDTSIITVSSAEIELQDSAGDLIESELPNPFSVPATGVVPTAGESVGLIQAVPAVYGELLRGTSDGEIVAVIRVNGTTTGGTDVESVPFSWPIRVCFGCLFGCELDATSGQPMCDVSCNPGQDELSITPSACVDPGTTLCSI